MVDDDPKKGTKVSVCGDDPKIVRRFRKKVSAQQKESEAKQYEMGTIIWIGWKRGCISALL